MKHIQTLFLSLLFFTGFFLQSLHAQNEPSDFLTTLVQAENHSELKAYTVDALFLYKIEDKKLCVYASGDEKKPIQVLDADSGYDVKVPFAMTLSSDETKIVVIAQANGKILTFRRNTETGHLELEEEKTF